MNRKQVEKLIRVFTFISSLLILTGAIFQLQHYPYGEIILWIGILLTFLLNSWEIGILKRRIKELEED